MLFATMMDLQLLVGKVRENLIIKTLKTAKEITLLKKLQSVNWNLFCLNAEMNARSPFLSQKRSDLKFGKLVENDDFFF